jgi:hypothetical protein
MPGDDSQIFGTVRPDDFVPTRNMGGEFRVVTAGVDE